MLILKGGKMGNNIRHGELFLQEVSEAPQGKVTKHTMFVAAHSETGHHHIVKSKTEFEVIEGEKEELYIRLFEPAKIVHQKQVDKHKTLPVKPGIYKVIKKTEFDPFDGLIREVHD